MERVGCYLNSHNTEYGCLVLPQLEDASPNPPKTFAISY